MTEPRFILTRSNEEFAALLPTRSVEQLDEAIRLYREVLLPLRDTDGMWHELAMLERERASREGVA